MRELVLPLALALLVAGCAVPAQRDAGDAAIHPRPDAFVVRATHRYAIEPSLGITREGSMFVVAYNDVLRSRDEGATWDVVNSYTVAGGFPPTLDPWLAVDPITDRVYVDHLTAACTSASWSDDDGATWTPFEPAACGAPLTDFQKTAAGPPGPVANPLASEAKSVVYMCYNKPTLFAPEEVGGSYGTSCAASYDGGATFVHEQMLSRTVYGPMGATIVAGCDGGAWGPAIAPDGVTVVRAQPDCLFRSRDSGASWESLGTGPPFAGTQLAFDRAGVLYALSFPDASGLRMARSTDQGTTWSAPWNVSIAGVGSYAFQALVAGDAGRLAIAFLGNATFYNDTHDAPPDAAWSAYIITVEDADSAPRVLTYGAAGPPLHRGCIARDPPCPFMGDFVTMAESPEGTPWVVFPATCTPVCETHPSAVVVGLQGWSLKARE